MKELTESTDIVNGLPNFCGHEAEIEGVLKNRPQRTLADSSIDFSRIRSACSIALHMHQPLIPAGGSDPRTASLISNLAYMMENQHIGDNHNAVVFHKCYKRLGELIPDLIREGKAPRMMIEYTGTLLYGLRRMGLEDVFGALRLLTLDPAYLGAVEWLGAPWGHAVAPSTPIQDYRLHVRAWQHHFASIFGKEALTRVRGFSPSEMALPNHPDVAYEFVKTLKDCGYEWVLVQEHTVEQPHNGWGPEYKHIPHRLVCQSSKGETASIIAIIKTQGSDTKLVGQMQPYYEALGLSHRSLANRSVPSLVTQIADGENGGVMMNEFPPKYLEAVRESSGSETPLVNVSEYLAYLSSLGIREEDLPPLQPLFQKSIWDRLRPGEGPEALARVIAEVRSKDPRFHMEGGSWTNNISWVRGYENVIGPMDELSALFFEKALERGMPTSDPRYRNALFHLLASQTSCYRYWGEGPWTDHFREICRRAREILQ